MTGFQNTLDDNRVCRRYQAGKERLANEIDSQLGKQIDEQLGDKVPEEIKDALKKPEGLLKGLGGLLGGKKEEEK